ncbi:hypothetical protein [Maricaulis sp.]|uniref:hypothetical protein n=1 Tax=Maricaulis sp. TaxID=1486257 RepID=UPI001B04750E|nr:hypothetical protein [Maricaulis sp.]MBO6766500.1 hypothetical protein [Maricaulis sp.]
MSIKHTIMALGLAITAMTGAAGAQVIGGEVEIDGSGNDVVFLGGDMTVRGNVQGDISAIAGDGRIDADVTGSIHFFGGDVYIRGSVGEDIEIAGGDVEVDANVAGDVSAAGGDVRIGGTIGGELAAAGGNVEIEATVGDMVQLAGGYVGVHSDAVFADGLEVAGGEIEIAGTVRGDVDIEGSEVTLSGLIDGDVEILAEEVYILDSARVTGEISVRGPSQPVVASGAQIGTVDYEYEPFNFGAKHWDDIDIDIDGPWEIIGAPFEFLGLAVPGAALLLGALAVLMTPRGTARVARTFRRKPLVSGFLGFISFALSPVFLIIMTVLLAITVIGALLIPIMLVLYLPFLLLCLALGALAVGDLVLNRKPEQPLGMGMRLLSLMLVLAVSAALGAVPVLGALVGLLLMLIGLGAWLMSLGRENGQTAPAAAISPEDDKTVTAG